MIQYEFDYYYNYHCLLFYQHARIVRSCGYNYSFINHRYIILSIIIFVPRTIYNYVANMYVWNNYFERLWLRTRLIICIMRCLQSKSPPVLVIRLSCSVDTIFSGGEGVFKSQFIILFEYLNTRSYIIIRGGPILEPILGIGRYWWYRFIFKTNIWTDKKEPSA
jgi:hypothetical protein